eukprot:TRINITY_DN9518_c0_g1_i10.p1 TRINITY_DN9518_c0_g1~~TRINITY_DN9518_c0_g1_i10.p1  ORF type:complete len:119 (+),score=27.80 TRINITY_DN9518_c0_g1_i10:975-1331(+)
MNFERDRIEKEKTSLDLKVHDLERKLAQEQSRANRLKHELDQAMNEKNQYAHELKALSERYEIKSGQKRKLEDLYTGLKNNTTGERPNSHPPVLPSRTEKPAGHHLFRLPPSPQSDRK